MAFFNKAMLDDNAAIVLEEAKVEGYEELGLVYICHKAIQNKYMFHSKSIKTKLTAELYGVKLAKGANPVKLQDNIQCIKAKFLCAGLPCPHSNITGTAMKALAVEYQAAINNANIKCKIHGTILSMELLIAEARRMYKMHRLGQDARAD